MILKMIDDIYLSVATWHMVVSARLNKRPGRRNGREQDGVEKWVLVWRISGHGERDGTGTDGMDGA